MAIHSESTQGCDITSHNVTNFIIFSVTQQEGLNQWSRHSLFVSFWYHIWRSSFLYCQRGRFFCCCCSSVCWWFFSSKFWMLFGSINPKALKLLFLAVVLQKPLSIQWLSYILNCSFPCEMVSKILSFSDWISNLTQSLRITTAHGLLLQFANSNEEVATELASTSAPSTSYSPSTGKTVEDHVLKGDLTSREGEGFTSVECEDSCVSLIPCSTNLQQ